jgi:hypothetical protein
LFAIGFLEAAGISPAAIVQFNLRGNKRFFGRAAVWQALLNFRGSNAAISFSNSDLSAG